MRSDGGILQAVVLPDGTEVPRDVLFVAAPPAVVQALATARRAAVGVTRDLS